MGVGHAAVALGATRALPRVNVGWFIFAALLADFLLGIFASVGLEHAIVPPDYASRHYLLFSFPYSHGLLALTLWSILAGIVVALLHPKARRSVFVVIAALVLSHFVLDGLVHVAGLPLVGKHSPRFGLGLWKHMGTELALETAMALAGVLVYGEVAGSQAPRWSRWGIPVFILVLTALTWTQLFSAEAPTPAALANGWIVAPLALSAVAYALDRGRVQQPLPAS